MSCCDPKATTLMVAHLLAVRPLRSHWVEKKKLIQHGYVWQRGSGRERGDGNEGANCFQWILKSNSNPQCLVQAAHKWNIDERGENKRKMTPLYDQYESRRSVWNVSQQAIHFHWVLWISIHSPQI